MSTGLNSYQKQKLINHSLQRKNKNWRVINDHSFFTRQFFISFESVYVTAQWSFTLSALIVRSVVWIFLSVEFFFIGKMLKPHVVNLFAWF